MRNEFQNPRSLIQYGGYWVKCLTKTFLGKVLSINFQEWKPGYAR